jgi:hypothetical protein
MDVSLYVFHLIIKLSKFMDFYLPAYQKNLLKSKHLKEEKENIQ